MSRVCTGVVLLMVCFPFLLLTGGCNDVRSMRRSRDVPGLVKLLSDHDPHTRVKAVDALGYVGDSRAIRPLIKALRDENAYVREHAARNLGCDYHSSLGCDTGDAIQPLLAVLDDDDVFVRVEAARSLGEHPLAASRGPLETLAKRDRHWEVRQAAAFALGRIGNSASLALLESMTEDSNPQVVKTVREAIRRIGSTRSTTRNDDDRRLDVEVNVGSSGNGGTSDAGVHGDGGSAERGDGGSS